MTQELLRIPPRVALDKTLNSIRHLTLSISIEFDTDKTPEELTIIYLFRKGLKPLVKTQIKQHGWEI